jgi:hypothetical protein
MQYTVLFLILYHFESRKLRAAMVSVCELPRPLVQSVYLG